MMYIYWIFYLLVINLRQIYSLENEGVTYPAKTLEYLSRFGYYKTPDIQMGSLQVDDSIEQSIRSLQRFAGLRETGRINGETIALMRTPRCGMKDKLPTLNVRRKRRFVLQGSKWKKTDLTWRLQNNNNDGLSRQQVEEVVEKAFEKWSAVTNLNFRKMVHLSTDKADIEIKFATKSHGDPFPFDGAGGTLAHAFYPHDNQGLSGDVHFDDAESFTINLRQGRNLLWVAVHEIGHSLGLEHSSVKEAVMYPWYRKYNGEDFDLHWDDISGIQNIYGSRRKETIATTQISVTEKPKATFTCTDNIKAILLDHYTLQTYIINDDKVLILDRNLIISQENLLLKEVFPGVESADSAYIRPDKKVVFFKDDRYFVFYSMRTRRLVDSGMIYEKFFGLPLDMNKIDAAFNWSPNGRTYLFTGDKYYRYDEWRGVIDNGYPKIIKDNWRGVPQSVDAVFEWRNKKTYFFKDSKYYRFNNNYIRVQSGYPRYITGIWLKCKRPSVGLVRNAAISLAHAFNKLLYVFLPIYISYSICFQ